MHLLFSHLTACALTCPIPGLTPPQGPTYSNWSKQADDAKSWGWHPATYRTMDGALLARMRQSTPRWDVACDWAAALAAVPGRFMSLAHWEWGAEPPGFEPLPPSCPLLARKFAPEATDSLIAALWPDQQAHDLAHERRRAPRERLSLAL